MKICFPYTSLTVPFKPCQLCALRTWKGTIIFLAHNLMELKEFGKKHRLDSVFILKKKTVPLHPLTKYSWVFNCQEATDEAVLLWAKRVQSDYNRKAPKSASAKQKAFGLLKLGGWFFSKISKFSKPFTPKPWTENGPAWCWENARVVFPGLLHVVAEAEDGSPAWERFRSFGAHWWNVGPWATWTFFFTWALGIKTHHSGLWHPNPLECCGIQIPNDFCLYRKFRKIPS